MGLNNFRQSCAWKARCWEVSGSAVDKAAEVPPADVLWIAVKATQLEDALRSVPDPMAPKIVVPLLNGIDHVARLREIFAHERVVAGTIAGEMERVAPGRYLHPSPFLMLNVAGSGRAIGRRHVRETAGPEILWPVRRRRKDSAMEQAGLSGPVCPGHVGLQSPDRRRCSRTTSWHRELEDCVREFVQ